MFKKLSSIVVVLGLACVISSPCMAAKESKVEKKVYRGIAKLMREAGFKAKTASWTSQITQVSEGGKTETSESKAWISGDQYRLETKDKQKQQLQVIIDDGKDMYMYSPSEKKAFKMGNSENSLFGNVLNNDLIAESARQRKTAKKVGSETVEGKPCTIYEYRSVLTIMNNKVTSDVKEWLWSKENFPIKNIVKTPKYKMKIVFMTTDVPASETTTLVKDLVLNGSIDDKLFAIPAGTAIETMEMPAGMMGGNGEAQEGNAAPSSKKPKNEENNEEESQQGPPPAVKDMLKSLF